MKLFPFANKEKREYAPDETPLGPKTYPRVGSKPTVLDILSRRRWWFISIGLGVVLLIVFIVLLVQRNGGGGILSQVQLSVDGPEQITLGSDVTYTVTFANNSSDPLENARLLVIYPEGFSFTSADPKADNTPGTEFSFGTLKPGDGKEVLINGRLVGGVKSDQVLIARLQFTMPGSTDILQVEATFTTKIETAGFAFAVDAPATALPNNKINLSATLENNESAPLTGLQIRATYPGGFDFTSSDPIADAEERIWDIKSLGVGEKRTFKIEGVLGGGAGEIKRFVFEAGVLDQDGNFLKQTEVEKAIKLTQPAVTVTQTLNNEQKDAAVDGSESLEYTVAFENTGSTGLSNLVLEVNFTDGAWDPSTLVINDGGALQSGNVLHWDGTAVPELRTLGARQKAEVSFQVRPFFEIQVDDAADKQFSTTSTPRIKIGNAGTEGNPITVKYRAGITPGASAKIVSGANPPAVNQQTIYEVTWTLTNLYNELSGARLVGTVPPGAEFVAGSGHVSAGEDLTFNQNTGQILWNIGKVPANVGKLTPVISATFQIKIIPQANESKTKKLLVTNQSFTAHDTWTNEEREEAVPDVQSAKIK
ncbi:MAG: hypothetical protein U0517_01035 [Candidatus Andersenbacteria bacterium]